MFKQMCVGFLASFSLLIVLMAGPASAELKTLEILLAPAAVSTHVPQDSTLGSYYTFRLDVPVAIDRASLKSAFLEFYVDVSARAIDGWTNDTPVVEVYALNADYSGQLDQSKFRRPSPMVRPIRLGTKNRVVMNATEIVRSYLADPSTNHGLIVGSFRGGREGIFTLRSDQLGDGVVAKITFLYTTPAD